jgi:hypothetical protein
MSDFPPESAALKGLHETIDLICADAARAELWASALNAFAQPVPEYDPALLPVERWPQPRHS